MKIDRSKVKKGASEVPEDCAKVIYELKSCPDANLLEVLQRINIWYFGKCELYHWIDVLDRFDAILAVAARAVKNKQWIYEYDCFFETFGEVKGKEQHDLIFQILKFTALLIEHSYARHLYNSMEHLVSLLDCVDGNLILSVLNLIYVFSKRSNYLSRLSSEKKKVLQIKLSNLAQTWGGVEAGCSLSQCCSEDIPSGAGHLYFEYYGDSPTDNSKRHCIDLKNVHNMSSSVGEIMEDVMLTHRLPENMQMVFYHRLRLAYSMAVKEKRLQFVQARLQAISILVYSNATSHVNFIVYDGLIEEIVNTLKLLDGNKKLSDVKASCLKTLTAIIHLDRNPRLQAIIECTGATSYHGFLPSLVRQCILHMTNPDLEPFTQSLSTALFSFLYHLASYESGCEALVSSGLIESLLKVVVWPGENEHITFVTRAVRVIDLITNLDMAAFQTHNGLDALVGRLQREVLLCSKHHSPALSNELPSSTSDVTADFMQASLNTSVASSSLSDVEMKESLSQNRVKSSGSHQQCLPQRAALLKSILNFLKKAIPDPAFAEYTRTLMDENLQDSLKMIISNAEYYGALLFLLATDVVTVFIFHEPSLLSSLQDTGLTWVVLKALLLKDVPATRENLASLPNTLSALCLNTRGLNAFVSCAPFEKLFRILIIPEYLPAMKRRRSADPQGDTAMHLGSAMDELMRHQPTLKTDAMKAIIKLLKQLYLMGNDDNVIAFHPTEKSKPTLKKPAKLSSGGILSRSNVEDNISDDEMEEEYLLAAKNESLENAELTMTHKKFVPVVDYLLNVTKFLDSILSNNGTDDHCVEFVKLGGLEPLFMLLSMPNFPLEFPLMPACQSVAQVCKSINLLAQDSRVFKEGLTQLNFQIDKLNQIYTQSENQGSALLHELASTEVPLEALYDYKKTPVVHAMSTTHAYVNVFVFICRGAQADIRNMSISQWGSDLGQCVLKKLTDLYAKLVWESGMLLILCTPNNNSEEDLSIAAQDLNKLKEKQVDPVQTSSDSANTSNLTLLKWLLLSSSHLGRALAELFGLLVHQCVGAQGPRLRHTFSQPSQPSVPARMITYQLTSSMVRCLKWECPSNINIPRLRLTFYVCCIGIWSVALFDSGKNPYHLMLQQLEKDGGLEALFDLFNWVVDKYLSNCNDLKKIVGLSEFLDGWLDLINRLVNTKSVLESNYGLPTTSSLPGFIPFDTANFLAKIHMLAFKSVLLLWERKIYACSDNHSIADRIVSIMCHIISGEVILKETFALKVKPKDSKQKKSSAIDIQKTPTPSRIDQVSEEHLQQFVDMGFLQEHAREALITCHGNFQAATELLLTMPSGSSRLRAASSNVMEVDTSEEDMMLQAIAMSLGQEVEPLTSDKKSQISDSTAIEDKRISTDQLAEISKLIDNCTDRLLEGCMELLDTQPKAVHSVCKLLVVTSRRNKNEWKSNMLVSISEEITTSAVYITTHLEVLLKEIKGGNTDIHQKLKELTCDSTCAEKLTRRLHLFLLLSQNHENQAALTFQTWIYDILNLFKYTMETITELNKSKSLSFTPGYLAPIILIFDHYERTSLVWKRKKMQICSHIWKWFDDRSGRWCNYSASNNASIDTAYHSGESTVRFTSGRRKYMVLFNTLVQINEETGNRRPIMLDVMLSPKIEDSESVVPIDCGTKKIDKAKGAKRKADISDRKKIIKPKDDEITGLSEHQNEELLSNLVDLISMPIASDILNAAIRMLLRLTRVFKLAKVFANKGGIQHLLNLKESSSFSGAIPLVVLLLRHIVENSETMKHAVERAVVTACNNGIPNMFCGVGQNSLGARELHYLLRALGPIACRNTNLYIETTMKVAKLLLPSSRGRNQLEETIPPNSAQIVKVPQEIKGLGLDGAVESNPEMEHLVVKLLNSLIERHLLSLDVVAATTTNPLPTPEVKKISSPQTLLVRRLRGENVDEDEIANVQPTSLPETPLSSTTEASIKPLLSEACIIRLLTELVKSYAAVAKLIVEFSYHHPDDGPSVPNNMVVNGPFLAFFFDYLLPHTGKDSDPIKVATKSSNISTLARALLSYVGTYWHNTDIESVFVDELKASYMRALMLPECKVKHLRLQALFNLVTLMVESAAPISFTSQPPVQNIGFVKILIKRGLIADLARCTHSLDLSSQDLVTTVNAMLKPLEKLTNLASNQIVQPAKSVLKEPKEEISTVHDTSSVETANVVSQSLNVDVGNQNSTQSFYNNLEGVINEILTSNGSSNILGETLVTERSGDNGVEQEIVFETNGGEGADLNDDSDSSLDQDGNNLDTMSEVSEGTDSDQHGNMFVTLDDNVNNDSGDEDAPNNADRASNNIELEIQVGQDDIDDEIQFGNITENQGNDSQMEDDLDNDDDEDEDEENLNEDEENLNEDEADEEDTDEDVINVNSGASVGPFIFEEDDDEGGDTVEISFPQPAFTVHIPHLDEQNDTAIPALANRSSILIHPMLLDQPLEQNNRGPTNNEARNVNSRGNRGAGRVFTQRNTIHIHGNSNPDSIAQIFIGDDINQTNDGLSLEEDLFSQIEGSELTAGVLNSIPSSLARWTLESLLLDGSSVHDLVNYIKPSIVAHLEKLQLQELKEKVAEEKKKKEESEAEKATQLTSTVPSTRSRIVNEISEPMDVSPASVLSSTQPSLAHPSLFTTPSDLSLSNAQSVPLVPNQITNVDTVLSSGLTTQLDTPSSFVTPFNPLPYLVPNAPLRESLFSGLVPVSMNSPNVNSQQSIISQQTPFDAPRINRLRENDNALTGDLGFTPIAQYLHQIDLPDTVQCAMPGESPCIRQVRSNLMFSQTPQTTAAEEPRRTEEGAILATELAAAIMLQLATTSPTPFSTANIRPINVVAGSSISNVNLADPNLTLAASANTETCNEVEVSTTNEALAVSTSSLSSVSVPVGAEASINNAAAQIQRELENLGIPISVDPSFLAALPENIREEVLREQFGIRLSRPIASASSSQANVPEEPQEISPEFLAALPADMQREVLEQQRQEQARYNAAQQRPEQPVDPAEFVRNLDPSLRRQILADMDDTVLAVLPPELTSEAQGLRREIEQRQLRIHAERAITRNDLSQLLRHSGLTRRNSRGGFQFARLFPQTQLNAWQVSDSTSNNTKKVGTQLLDPESLTCLLVLLFLNDTAINSSRLHRILRNLSYHNLTKQWIINALISILRQTSSFSQESSNMSFEPLKNLESTSRDDAVATQSHQWLSRTLNLAFGGCVNIFQLQAVGKKPTDCFVTVHQQACLDVCKQTLEALSFLAKNFPSNFAPSHETKTDINNESGPSKTFETERGSVTEFWDILVRLNLASPNLKGKGPLKVLREFPKEQLSDSFVTSPLGQILSMLSHPVVKQSTLLSDKLLRLLAVISTSLPERHKQQQPELPVNQENAHPPDDVIVTQPIHTVTFVEPSTVHHEPAFEDPDQHAAESSTVCSETASITSSLFVEPSENNFERISYPVESRHHTTGSVVSDGTVAQSDYSMLEQRADDECMDIDHQNAHSDTSSTENRSSPALSYVQITEKEPSILTGQLRMAVNVLASGSCSDEGLEDATTLLLQLSRTDSLTRDCILELLLEGAQDTANILREEIASLLNELKEHNMQHSNSKSKMKTLKQNAPVVINPAAARSQPWRGRGAARLPNQPRRIGLLGAAQQRRNVQKPIIFELHLPTMALLTAKRSSQLLLLRILKVILQLRNAAKKSALKPKVTPIGSQRNRGIRLIERLQHGGSSLREVVAALEADMEAMYEMIDRFGSGNTSGESLRTTTEPVIQPQESSSTSLAVADNESKKNEEINIPQFAKLSNLLNLGQLWDILGEALTELAETSDPNAVLVLQPAVEAFFLVHGSEKENKTITNNESNAQEIQSPLSPSVNLSNTTIDQCSTTSVNLSADTQKFLSFAETHRTVLNQILRQSSSSLADGPFAVLVHHTRLLDFDVKRRYFRQELEKENKGHRREDMAVHIRREHIFEDSYRELHRRTAEELKNRLYVVFDGEEGQDAGGLLREWYGIMAREMFNPNYALFTNSQGEKSTYLPNQHSHCNPNHLSYFKFAGRIVAKAIYDNKLLDCYFTRSFYKHILGKSVHYSDMEAEDYSFYQGLVYLLEHDIDDLGYELTFSAEVQVFGMNEIHDLKPNGRNIPVTEDTKREYVKLVCQEKMTGSIRQQIGSFLEGFYEIIPKRLISIFDEQELELLIAGLPTIDIEDLKMNTEYHKYTENSLQIQWLWRALRSFDQADRAKFLQFVTGTSKVPLQGFVSLEGMNGPQKFQIHRDDRSTDRLPCAHTCFNQLDLPAYETYDKLHSQMLKAINECPEGFGLA